MLNFHLLQKNDLDSRRRSCCWKTPFQVFKNGQNKQKCLLNEEFFKLVDAAKSMPSASIRSHWDMNVLAGPLCAQMIIFLSYTARNQGAEKDVY